VSGKSCTTGAGAAKLLKLRIERWACMALACAYCRGVIFFDFDAKSSGLGCALSHSMSSLYCLSALSRSKLFSANANEKEKKKKGRDIKLCFADVFFKNFTLHVEADFGQVGALGHHLEALACALMLTFELVRC